VELLDERVVALPPVSPETARRLLARLKVNTLLTGHRGSPPLDIDALVAAIVAVSHIAHELGDHLEALDVNPLIVGTHGAIAVDALVVPRQAG
jgi:hypothetical protein